MNSRIANPHRKTQNRLATLTRNASVLLIAVLGLPAVATAQWTEDFDSYTAGTVLDDVGGWFGWNDNPNGAGTVSDIRSRSGPHSIVVSYRDGNDAIRPFTGYTSGVWSLIVYQFIPSSLADMSYFVLNNEYNHGGPYTWAIETHFDPQTGMVNENIRDSSGANALPIIYDAWIEIATIIDLNANTVEHYYDGQLLVNGTWAENGGPVEIANLNLYAPHNARVFYDDLTLNPPRRCWGYICGDANCDGSVNFADIEALLFAINNPAGYAQAYPNCDWLCSCDINRDCHVDEADIDAFFLLMGGVPCEQIPRGCRWYYGLEHCPLGDDVCFGDDGSGNLLVTNIGSSGQDGMSIHLGDEAEGFFFETELDPALPPDIEMVVAGIGTVNGASNQPTGTLSLTHSDPELFPVSVDFSALGAVTHSVEIYIDNSLIYQESGLIGDEIALEISSATGAQWGARRSFASVQIDEVILVHIRAGAVPGDLVVFRPENPTMSVDALSRFDVTLADLNPLTVYDEALLKFRHDHHALGQAHMNAGSDILTISNIGSSGEDGVAIDLVDVELAETDRFHVALDPVDLGTADAAIAVSATGSLDNVPDTVLGTVGYRNNNPVMQLVADFSVFGVPEVRVEVYDGGAFRGSFVDPDGGIVAIVTVPSGEAQITQTGIAVPASSPPGYSLKYDQIARIDQYPVGAFFYGDQVRFVSDVATTRVEDLTAFDITAKELTSLVITDEIADPCGGHLCGDANCDGIFNGADIDSFFLALGDPAQWSVLHPNCTMECVADINRDNAVNGGDIDAFFMALGNGSCP